MRISSSTSRIQRISTTFQSHTTRFIENYNRTYFLIWRSLCLITFSPNIQCNFKLSRVVSRQNHLSYLNILRRKININITLNEISCFLPVRIFNTSTLSIWKWGTFTKLTTIKENTILSHRRSYQVFPIITKRLSRRTILSIHQITIR